MLLLCYPTSRRRRSRVGLLFRVRIYVHRMDYLLYGLYLLYLGTVPEVGTVGVWHLQNRASR